MKNHVVIPNSSSILLALFALENQTERKRDNADTAIPLGSLYNRVSNDNDEGWIELHTFNTTIENLQEAGLMEIHTPKANAAPNGAEGTPLVTAFRTVTLTPAGRTLAEQHPEWSGNEAVPERSMAAAGGSRGH